MIEKDKNQAEDRDQKKCEKDDKMCCDIKFIRSTLEVGYVSKKKAEIVRVGINLLQKACSCCTNAVILVCENSCHFRKQAREMLLQHRRIKGQQLSQP